MPPEETLTDDRQRFSRAEFVAAFSLLVSQRKAERWTDELMEPAPPGTTGHTHLSEDVLDLLSLVSDDCAERVRQLREHSPEEATERRDRMRESLRPA